MKKLVLVAMILVVILTMSANAADIYVDDSGGADHLTIQAAVNAASATGDIIYVAAGTYNEKINLLGKSLELLGDSVNTVTIDASSETGYAVSNFGDDTTIKNVTLIGTPDHYGFKVSHVDNILLENIKVEDSYRTGVDLNTVTNSELKNIEVVDTPWGFGIMILDSDNIDVSDVTTSGNAWGGVSVQTVDKTSDAVVFSGSFDAAEDVPFLVEQDPDPDIVAPLTFYDVTNLVPPVQFDYITYGYRAADDYKQNFYQETLQDAQDFADTLMIGGGHSNILIFDLAKENYYVEQGMSIQEAIDDATGTTIHISPGTFVTGSQLFVTTDLTIQGSGIGTTILQPGYDTGTSGDMRGWILVDDGIELHLKDMTLDGSSNLVYQAVRHKGFGSVDNVHFDFIQYNPSGPQYSGVAIAAFGTGPVDVTNSVFTDIGRVGVLYYGSALSGSIFEDNSYTGKGVGDWLDYALDISNGADVAVRYNTISGNRGVASSDNSTSAGILVSTYFGPGTAALINYNQITDSTTAVAVGYDPSDTSDVEMHQNNIYGNDNGVSSTNPVVDATGNWWGDDTGPMAASNPGGLGDSVDDQVLFDPWLCELASSNWYSINGECVQQSIGPGVGVGIGIGVTPEQFAPRIWMDPNTRVVLDDYMNPGVITGGGDNLTERIENYAFTGEQIFWQVMVWDKNGIEKVEDVYVRLSREINSEDYIEANCREADRTGLPPFDIYEGEELIDEWNTGTMRWYDCLVTVEPQWHGEYFAAAVVHDLNGLWDEFAENEYWFMNPVIALGLTGSLDFGIVRPGSTVLSDSIVLSNNAEAGSGVLLDMYIAGTDFYDETHSGAACPDSNVLRLSNFRYHATSGAYNTCDNPGADAQCYDDIPYFVEGPGDPGNNGMRRIIEDASLDPYHEGNVLSPGADITLNFKLSLPEPCTGGPFDSGQIKFYGGAI